MVEKNVFRKDYFEEGSYGKQDASIIQRNYRLLLDYAKTTIPSLNELKLILDFGCALGSGTAFLARQFPNAKIIGVDISNYAIEKAKSNYERDSIDYYCLDLSNADHVSFLRKKYGGFDLIFTRDTLEHIGFGEQKKILDALNRLLRRKGILVVQTPNKLNPFTHSDITHIGLRSPISWKRLFTMSFREVEIVVRQYVPLLWQFSENRELLEFHLPIFGYNIYIFAERENNQEVA